MSRLRAGSLLSGTHWCASLKGDGRTMSALILMFEGAFGSLIFKKGGEPIGSFDRRAL